MISMKYCKSLLLLLMLGNSIAITSCDKENDYLIEDIEHPESQLAKPEFDKYLTTTTTDIVSLRCRFKNGGDTWNNMKCTVHWRVYSSKPSTTPKASDMTNHESMRQYSTTKLTTTFDKTHAGYSGGNYIYYYFECSNSKYTTKTNITFCVVKR